jgi:hypothetical protein
VINSADNQNHELSAPPWTYFWSVHTTWKQYLPIRRFASYQCWASSRVLRAPAHAFRTLIVSPLRLLPLIETLKGLSWPYLDLIWPFMLRILRAPFGVRLCPKAEQLPGTSIQGLRLVIFLLWPRHLM